MHIPRRLRQALTEQAHLQNQVRDLQARVEDHERRLAELAVSPHGHAPINAHERRVFSQNGEDGILEFIFATVGATNRTFVEFGIQDGRECNTANLSINHGWSGLLLEGDAGFASAASSFYAEALGPEAERVRIRQAWVTAENIDALLLESGVSGEIDLLSIDIDGNDLWVWQAITAVRPRVVVIEYNASFGPTRSLSTAYDANFERFGKHPSGLYHGASLAAMAKAGRRRGYLLVGCDSEGVNCFLVDEQVEAASGLGEIPAPIAYYPQSRRFVLSVDEQMAVIEELELVEV